MAGRGTRWVDCTLDFELPLDIRLKRPRLATLGRDDPLLAQRNREVHRAAFGHFEPRARQVRGREHAVANLNLQAGQSLRIAYFAVRRDSNDALRNTPVMLSHEASKNKSASTAIHLPFMAPPKQRVAMELCVQDDAAFG